MKFNLLSIFGKKQTVNDAPVSEEIAAMALRSKGSHLCVEDAKRAFALYRQGGEIRQLANDFNVYPYVIDRVIKSEGAAGSAAGLKAYEKRQIVERKRAAVLAKFLEKEAEPSVEVVPPGEIMTKAIIEAQILKEVLSGQQRKLAVQEALIGQLATRCDRLQEQNNKASVEQASIRSDLLKNDEAVNQMLGMTVGHKNQIGKIFAMCKSAGIAA